MRRITLAVLFVCFAMVKAGEAQSPTTVPPVLRISGSVTNIQKTPRVLGILFSLYKEQQGGSSLWSEIQNVKLDADGNYTVVLGSEHLDGVPADVFTGNDARWLGIQVQGEAEQPRTLLVSVPYAVKAGDADTLGGMSLQQILGTGAGPLYSTAVPTQAIASAEDHSRTARDSSIGAGVPGPHVHIEMYSPSIGQIHAYDDGTNTPLALLINPLGGNVGIGLTETTSKLTVGGMVESVLGGFKFPDGTVQTSAATGTSYAAGTGLSLTANTFSVKFAGTGTSTSAARSDHDHDGAYIKQIGGTFTGPVMFSAGQLFPGTAGGAANSFAGTQTVTVSSGNAIDATNTLTSSPGGGSGFAVKGTGYFGVGGFATSNGGAAVYGWSTNVVGAGGLFVNSAANGDILRAFGANGDVLSVTNDNRVRLPNQGLATASSGTNSSGLQFQASAFNSSSGTATTQYMQWRAVPSGNNTASPSATLSLYSGTNQAALSATGLNIDMTGKINFASGQRLAGISMNPCSAGWAMTGIDASGNATCALVTAGTITGVTAGTGLTGGGSSGTVTLNANTSVLQARVNSTCTTTQAIRGVDVTGGTTCVDVPPSTSVVPAGYTIMGSSPFPPSGFSVTGNWMTMNGLTPWDAAGTWPDLPAPLSAFAYEVFNGDIYVFGGINGTTYNYVNVVYQYDASAGAWYTKAPMANARAFATAVAYGNYIYVFGGRNGSVYLNVCEKYDPANNVWVTGASGCPAMPVANSAAAMSGAAVTTGSNAGIYLFGGENGTSSFLTQVLRYNVASATYDTNTSPTNAPATLPFGMGWAAAKYTNGKIYIMGGARSAGTYNVDNLAYDAVTNSYAVKASLPSSRATLATAVSPQGWIYISGGNRGNIYLDDLFIYDPASDRMITAPKMLSSRAQHGAAVIGPGWVVVFGGSPGGSTMDAFRPERLMYMFNKN